MVQEETNPFTRRFDKILKIFIIMASLILAAELIWLLGVSPFRPLARIDISGLEAIGRGEITREDVLFMAQIGNDMSYFNANPEMIERSLMRYSFLESARVYRHFPDRLHIVLEGRRAVASAFTSIGGITIPLLIDSQGVIFEIGTDVSNSAFSLPVISGLIIEEPFPGMKLPDLFNSLFLELEKLQISSPLLLGAVSEIKINRRAWDAYDIEIFPMHSNIRVRLSELNEDILRYTLLMIDVLASNNGGLITGAVDSLDFRSGIASYVPREAFFE